MNSRTWPPCNAAASVGPEPSTLAVEEDRELGDDDDGKQQVVDEELQHGASQQRYGVWALQARCRPVAQGKDILPECSVCEPGWSSADSADPADGGAGVGLRGGVR